MTNMMRRTRAFGWLGTGVLALTGCSARDVCLPSGYLPRTAGPADQVSAGALAIVPATPTAAPPKPGEKSTFDLPPALPGAGAPAIVPPKFTPTMPATERDKATQQAYPALQPVSAAIPVASPEAMTLAQFQEIALANSPVIRRAKADSDAAYGQVIQAGLYPNPNVGYQADQVQPSLRIPPGNTGSGAGQQGGFINQLIKTAGKLSLNQQVAGFDYINALVDVRKAEIAVTTAVRSAYFTALVAQQSLEVNKSLADLADEVYRLQLKQVAVGQAAGYEPLQLYAQAVQARNALAQAEATYKAAWRQVAAAAGQPTLPLAPLCGRADVSPPPFLEGGLKDRMLEQHTDLLSVRNTMAQAQTNLVLQKRMPIPDLQTSTYQQYDNAAQTYQFGVQIGVQLPVHDRNQGNIRSAQAKIASAGQQLRATENDLIGRLAEAYGRYESSTRIVTNYRDEVLPSLSRAYRSLVRRYQVEPDKVSFNDIVVAQQNLGQALQSYLQALDSQWRAVVDLANLGQLDELYPAPPPEIKK
ncbi:TolC family protein [Limnoglobus roseus]|nr:TolC family protein [Limnoglobus roseus]